MKLKKGSVKTLFLVLLWQAAICSSDVTVPKSTKIVDVLDKDGEQDVSFKSEWTKKKNLRDPFLPKDISRLTTFFAERTATFNENQDNACSLSEEVLAQIFRFSARAWLVDDNAVGLLRNDLQSLVECTKPRERVVFANKRTIKLVRTLEIVHKLEFIGKPTGKNESIHVKGMIPSLTCPYSKPALLVRASKFTATALNITGCASSSASSSAAVVLEQQARVTLNRLVLENNQNRAIYVNQSAYLILTKSQLVNNTISGNGGAVYVHSGSTIHVEKSTFKRNSANTSDGGAIFLNRYNSVVIKDSTFTENECKGGGGAIILHSVNTLLVHGSLFTNHSSPNYGGAMSISYDNMVDVDNSTFTNNTCRDDGGAIFLSNRNRLRIQGSLFTNHASRDDGGVMYIASGSKVDVEESTFADNTSGYWGGVICGSDASNVRITSSTFRNNKSRYAGGAIRFVNGNKLIINGSSFTNNICVSENGGALSLHDHNALYIYASSFTNNIAKYGVGGAIRLYRESTIDVKESLFAHNTCGSNGGAVFLYAKNTFVLHDSTLSNNVARQNGGGVFLEANNTVVAYQSLLTRNVAMKNGGALQLNEGNHATFIGSTLSGNNATNGSVSNLGKHNTFHIKQAILSDNICAEHGSVLYLGTDNVVVGFASNITNNKAGQTSGQYNGAIYSNDTSSYVAFFNSIISGNKKIENGAIYHYTTNEETSANSHKGIMV